MNVCFSYLYNFFFAYSSNVTKILYRNRNRTLTQVIVFSYYLIFIRWLIPLLNYVITIDKIINK